MTALVPLATSAEFEASAYADMAKSLGAGELDRIMLVSTRACEGACKTRLAPFTDLVETTRLQDSDVDDIVPSGMPLPAQAQMGLDYSRALSIPQMVRHFWVRHYPREYPDMWTGSITSFQVSWALQTSPYVVPPEAIAFEPDTGHGRFNVGTFVPPGTTGIITYSGGFTDVPEDLNQAALHMAASTIARMLDPIENSVGDPNMLRREALLLLVQFGASTPKDRP